MSLEDIEWRLRVLEDIEEIKRLKARYCAFCDDSFNLEALATVYTEDAYWEMARYGTAQGRDQILVMMSGSPQRTPFVVHMVMNPIIEVDGDKATGVWYLFMARTHAEGDQAVWGSARYDEEYTRVGGEWKISRQKVTENFRTPFDQGWAKKRFM